MRKLGPEELLLGPVRLCEKHGLPRDGLCRAIAAVLRAHLPGDGQAAELRRTVTQFGARGAVERIAGAPLQDETAEAIEAHYASLAREVA